MGVSGFKQIEEIADGIVKNFEFENKEWAIDAYKADKQNFHKFTRFQFEENKSEAHKALADELKNGYKSLNSDIKKQFKLEFFKQNERRCPMCGQLLETSKKSSSSIPTADLDHFFPKDKYPQFSLLPQNLIPTCMECNRIEKHTASITPKIYKKALEELGLLNNFQKHPYRFFKIWHVLRYDFQNEKIKLEDKPNAQILTELYGLERRYYDLKEKCYNILFNILKGYEIRSPESLENFLENMVTSNWYEVNDSYSLNNSPQIWQEFLEWILYSESNLLALWEEIKDYSTNFYALNV